MVATLLVAPVDAEEQSVRPGVNRQYQDPDFGVWVQRFERPGREVFDQREQIVEASGVEPGMDVADIGAGTGLFTRLFADRVGSDGHVYAVDISQVFVDNVLRRSRKRGQDNVRGVVNSPKTVALPADSIDLAFICDTYHHFEFPQSMMQSVHRALRGDGELVLIDFRKREGRSSQWVMNHVRADKAAVIAEVEAAGFELVEDLPLLETNYFLRFRPR